MGNLLRFVILLCLLQSGVSVYGQKRESHKADTSFTITQTYLKEVNRRPYITVGIPDRAVTIPKLSDVAYKKISTKRVLMLDLYGSTKGLSPVVVMVHGGGWSSGNRIMNESIALSLAKNGYVVASVEYRLSPEAKYPAAVCDIKSAVIFLKENARKYGIDSAKVAVVGFSAGGQLAALVGASNGTRKFVVEKKSKVSADVAAVVDVDGLLDFTVSEKALDDTATAFKSDLLWLNGNFQNRMEQWIEASPITWVNRHSAPVLFINSSIPRFHCGRDAMIEKMNHFGIRSEVHTFEDTPHTFWFFNPWYEPTCQLITGYLGKILK